MQTIRQPCFLSDVMVINMANGMQLGHNSTCSYSNVLQYMAEKRKILNEKTTSSSLAVAQKQLLHQQFIQSCDKKCAK